MVRPAHQLITFSGLWGAAAGPTEFWSMGVRCVGNPASDLPGLNNRAASASEAFRTALVPHIGDNVALTKVSIAQVDATDHWSKTPDGQYVKGEWTGSIRGGDASQPTLPAQCALVLSLMTLRAGPSGKGRLFLPLGRRALDASGRLDTVAAQLYADRAALFVGTINQTEGDVSVVSERGFATRVNSIRVGRVVDTMRSRRADIAEEYKVAPVPS